MTKNEDQDVKIARLEERSKSMWKVIEALDERIDDCVTEKEFSAVRSIVFGGVALILIAVVTVGLTYIFRQ